MQRLEQATIRAFRENADRQQEFFRRIFNRIIERMGGERRFSSGETDKVASYWYVLNVIIEEWARTSNPYMVDAANSGFTDGVMSRAQLYRALHPKYKTETVRRYVSDLLALRLIERRGRGEDAMLALAFPTITGVVVAYAHWVRQFDSLQGQLAQLGAFALLDQPCSWWSDIGEGMI